MDKEVQDRLIEKCKTIVESEYRLEVPIRMTDIRASMIMQGIPFNILYKAYHVQEGSYMFYDHSELLTQVLNTFLTGVKLAYHRNSQHMIEHMEEKINTGRYRVNKMNGCIDVYGYDYGVVLFERRNNQVNEDGYTYYEIWNTTSRFTTEFTERCVTLEIAKEHLEKDHCDWCRPFGTGIIYGVELVPTDDGTINMIRTEVYKNDKKEWP